MPSDKNIRIIEHSGNKWRARETPNRFLALKGESQELFDSGFIGDDGLDNKDMRIKVYDGALSIETISNDITSQNKHINLNAGGNVNINANLDVNLVSGHGKDININSRWNIVESVVNDVIETIGGNKKEVINGSAGYERQVLYNSIISSNQDYRLNVGGNYLSTTVNTEQHNSRDAAFNTSNSFNVNSESLIDISSNNQLDLFSNSNLNIESNVKVSINSSSLTEVIKNIVSRSAKSYTQAVDDIYTLHANDINITALNDYKLIVKNYHFYTQQDYNITAKTHNLNLTGDYNIISKSMVVRLIDNRIHFNIADTGIDVVHNDSHYIKINDDNLDFRYRSTYMKLSDDFQLSVDKNANITALDGVIDLKGKSINIDTSNRGPIYLKVGSQYIDLDGCIIRFNNNKITISEELEATKVWNAVYN